MNRFTKLDNTGTDLPDDAAHWVAVRDNNLVLIDGQHHNLIWMRGETAERYTHENALKLPETYDLCGCSDWKLPSVEELQTITDRSRVDPAIDTRYFDSHGEWCWTSTPHASYADYAWCVDFSHGYVLNGRRYLKGFVRPVRRVPASQ